MYFGGVCIIKVSFALLVQMFDCHKYLTTSQKMTGLHVIQGHRLDHVWRVFDSTYDEQYIDFLVSVIHISLQYTCTYT